MPANIDAERIPIQRSETSKCSARRSGLRSTSRLRRASERTLHAGKNNWKIKGDNLVPRVVDHSVKYNYLRRIGATSVEVDSRMSERRGRQDGE